MPRKKAADDKPLTGEKTSSPAKTKTTADYVRDMRTRLRDAGLVKREFWILPENATALRGIEKALRQPFLGERIKLEAFMTENINWTINSLHKAAVEQAGFAVLKAPDIPSILVETAFISNPDEELKLRSERHQARFAESMHDGIRRYFAQNPPLARNRSNTG